MGEAMVDTGDTVARDLLMLNLKLILMLMLITDMAVALEDTVDMAMVDTADTAVPLEDMEESGDRPQTITISSSSINLIDYFFSKLLVFKTFIVKPNITEEEF